MRHLHVRHIEDIEAFVLSSFDRDIHPSLVYMTGKTRMKPHVIFKDKSIFLLSLRNSPPNLNV